MQYEDFIYDFVRLLKNWGVWRGVKILYGDKLYKTKLLKENKLYKHNAIPQSYGLGIVFF